MKAEDENWIIIAKYLKGELSEQERCELSEWVNAGPDNKKIFEQAKNLWITSDSQVDLEIDVDRNWQKFTATIGAAEFNHSQESTSAANKSKEPLQGIKKKGKQVLWPMLFRVAAAVTLAFLISYLLIRPDQQELMLVFESSDEANRELYLPDGSLVVLNRSSKISYYPDFNLGNRIVNLEGEAFFEVKNAEGYRFTVFAKNSKTEVVGTSFSVSAYDSLPNVEVKVTSGRVAFSLKDDSNTVFLGPGSRGILDEKTSEVKKEEVEHENHLSWKNKRLVYNNTPFLKVIRSLEDHFGERFIIASQELLHCHYSGRFEYPELENVLEVLRATMNISYSKDNGVYVINGPGCH